MGAIANHSGVTGLQEDGERSPRWSFSNGIECKRVFHGTVEECLAARLFRGQVPTNLNPIFCQVPGTGTGGGNPALFVQVWECEIIPLPGGKARLEITFAGGFPGAPLPANEEWIEPKQIDISLAFHPKYAGVVGGMTPLHEKRLAAIETLLGIKSTDVARASDNLKFIFTPGVDGLRRARSRAVSEDAPRDDALLGGVSGFVPAHLLVESSACGKSRRPRAHRGAGHHPIERSARGSGVEALRRLAALRRPQVDRRAPLDRRAGDWDDIYSWQP